MALSRCEKHTPQGVKHSYRAYALPIGYPDTAAICGRMHCDNPGRVWLEDGERAEHSAGGRIFRIKTFTAKLRVGDDLISN